MKRSVTGQPDQPSDLLANLSRNLRRLRKERGMTQATLATRAGISRRLLSTLETEKGNISLTNVGRLSAALSVGPAELIEPGAVLSRTAASKDLAGNDAQDPHLKSYVPKHREDGVSDMEDQRHIPEMENAPRRVGIIGYPGVNGFDIVGPSEVFATARLLDGSSAYAIQVLAVDEEPFVTEAGLAIVPHGRLADSADLDTIIVPGGAGLRQAEVAGPIAAWLKVQHGRARRIAAVCTGTYGLAAAGLLDGRKVTTHWRFAADLQKRHPQVEVDPDMIFVRDGDVYTSGGISAGIDLTLALIEEDLGPKTALAVAREMVVFLKRSGGQHQYSEPLKFQVNSGDRFAHLLAWVNDALTEDLSVARLAETVCLSPRQFTRAFRQTVGIAPAAYVEQLRMDRAAEKLSATSMSVDRAASQVGYRSADVFRRAFERRFGVTPGDYRQRFSTVGPKVEIRSEAR